MKLIKQLFLFLSFINLMASCSSQKYTGEDADLLWAIDNYGERIAKKYDMQFLYRGDVSGTLRAFYSIALQDSHPITIEKGRKFAIYLFQDFTKMLHTDQAILNYNEFYKKRSSNTSLKIPFNEIGFKITYWNNETKRFKPPYLAEIIFFEGELYFYEAEPITQKKQLVLKESYEDALKLTKTNT